MFQENKEDIYEAKDHSETDHFDDRSHVKCTNSNNTNITVESSCRKCASFDELKI